MSEFDEVLVQHDGLGLADLVRKKELAPRELVEAAITRIERLNPQLNAVIFKMYDLALRQVDTGLSDGTFKGVPFLLKDLVVDYAGVPTSSGSRFNQRFVPDQDSELVKRFKAAGFVILGKTNVPEYGLEPVTEPELFGPTRNPWDPTRTTGGSSGGSAAAVAARLVPLAHGSDGGGSIRIPASCCAVFGLKPSRGRNPVGPNAGEVFQGLHCDHVLTRSVRDSAAVLDATAGPDVGPPYYIPPPKQPFLEETMAEPGKLRIAYTHTSFLSDVVHADCIAGLEATVQLCRELGHNLVEAEPAIDGQALATAYMVVTFGDTRANIEEAEFHQGRRATARDFEPATWVVGLLGKSYTASDFASAIRYLKGTGRQIGSFFEQYDILLTPTLALPPVVTGSLKPGLIETLAMKSLGRLNAGSLLRRFGRVDETAKEIFRFMPYTLLANATGQPAMSVPLYWNQEGLPIGMQFMARFADEATLFRLASQLERASPWANRLPPICRVPAS